MQTVTQRFLLRDFVESDRSPFLDYQTDPRSQIFYEPGEANFEHSTRLFDNWLRVLNFKGICLKAFDYLGYDR